MKIFQLFKIAIVSVLLLILFACTSDKVENEVITTKPVSTTMVTSDVEHAVRKPNFSVDKIDPYKNIAISDWLDEDTVVVSKENDTLGKMSLEELADSFPKSLYLYHLDTKKYDLLKEQKNVFLGGAVLSPDKKHLLYSEFSLGDPVYHVMDLVSLKSFGIMGDPIAGALSATWTDDNTVIGPAYSGGAFTASTSGKLANVAGLNEEGLVIVQKMKDKINYNTNSNEALQAMNINTKEKTSLNLEHVYDVIPSPDGKQLLVLQSNDPNQSLILCDADGGNRKIIAKGLEIGGVSWSPDKQMIAYSRNGTLDGKTVKALYLYDMLIENSTEIVINVENLTTSWSPSSKKLAYSEWNEKENNSSIVYLTYSLQD